MKGVPQSVIVHPCFAFGGTSTVPGDKSISHRAIMLAALAQGESRIEGFLQSEDCLSTMHAMGALGASICCPMDGGLSVRGTGGNLRAPALPLDVGNSGTTMRLLSGLVAGRPFTTEITGDASLRSRPMKRIKEPLERMGARVELLGGGTSPPIRITGGKLKGITYKLPVASAQVKSCVLLAGLFAKGKTTVIEPRPTRDHTENMLAACGAPIRRDGQRIEVDGYGPGGPDLKEQTWSIPGDFSSAAFLILAAAGQEGATLTVEGVGLNPRRTAFLDVLRRMGAAVDVTVTTPEGTPEPSGRITIGGTRLQGTEVGGDEIPNLIDELPLVAVAGAIAEGQTSIRDAAELRTKESDRIATMAANLALMGVQVEEKEDGLLVTGTTKLSSGSAVQSRGDHRIAMAMAVLALYAEAPVCINQVACIETSYPGFWKDLVELGAHVER